MHRTDRFRLSEPDDLAAIAARERARTRGESTEVLIAVTAVVMILGALAGWGLPI